MLWVAILLVFACLFVFLWHPSIRNAIKNTAKYQLILLTTLLSFGFYGYYGSPFLSDHPFIRLEALSHPMVYQGEGSLETLIKTVQENPDHSLGWKNLADYYFHRHSYYESSLYYREAWWLAPQNTDLKIHYTHALVLLHHGKITPTIGKLLQELEKNSNLPSLVKQLKKERP